MGSSTALITCRCGAAWTALGAAHCATDQCHRTFSAVDLFDRHRQAYGEHGRCVDPTTIVTTTGQWVMFFRNGMWRGPELTEEQRAAMGWRR